MLIAHSNSSKIQDSFFSSRYQLLEKIGQGGFGEVFKATQVSTGQLVAIKFLRIASDLEEDKRNRYVARFHREIDLISRLHHPNVVQLIDRGKCDGGLIYAVYEYIDGQSLKEFLSSHGPLSAVDAAEVMAGVLDALAHAHAKGVIHRDIKPANIMLLKAGAKLHVKVLDFGIGSLVQEARKLDYESITLTQETLGTPAYSAPEQLRGEPPVSQTDIYVWGLVFLECLTGETVMRGSSLASIFHQQLSPANIPLDVLAGHDSASLMRRVLDKKVDQRPKDAGELYKVFRKINFANLVGTLASASSKLEAVPTEQSTQTMVQSRTQTISDTRSGLSYTRLAERKQVTILCIILGCEPLNSAHDGAQDVIDTMHADQLQQCIDIATRFGAYHVGTLGDTLVFYFGYPRASDSDSRLSARAALEVVSRVQSKNALLKLSHGIVSSLKMGIETGSMVSLANNMPEGRAAHNAMEMARCASSGQIVCSKNVKQLLDAYINFELAPNSQSNLERYTLQGERQLEAFGFLRGTRKNPVFIGRDNELAFLLDAVDGNRQSLDEMDREALLLDTPCVHIEGEAGIGKSRLIFELRDKTTIKEHQVAQCLPEHVNNALYPILNLVRYRYAVDVLDSTTVLNSLKKIIDTQSNENEQSAIGLYILASWLNIVLPEGAELDGISPESQKDYLFDTIARLLCYQNGCHDESEDQGFLFVCEDLHWADPSSREFIKYFTNSSYFKAGRHVWVNTSREGIPKAFSSQPTHYLKVQKLSKESTQQFIEYLFDHEVLSNSLMSVLLERTDGIPLFIEELTLSLIRQSLVHKVNGQLQFKNEKSISSVPLTLRDSLQQRLDNLENSKDTAQLAATIGREFEYHLLVLASNKEEHRVQLDLEELIAAELIFKQRTVSGDKYIFKHALVRDNAYDSVTADYRVDSHISIARALEVYHQNQLDDNAWLIAAHYNFGNNIQKACAYGCIAVRRQVKLSNNSDAIEFGMKVREWSSQVSDITQRDELFFTATKLIMPAVLTLHGYGSQYVEDIYHEVKNMVDERGTEQLSELVASTLDVCEWMYFLNLHYRSKRQAARRLGMNILDKAYLKNDRQKIMIVKGHLGQAVVHDGDLLDGVQMLEQSIELYRPEDKALVNEYGTDVKCMTTAICSFCHFLSGNAIKALEYIEGSLKSAIEIDHAGSISNAFLFVGLLNLHLQDKQLVNDQYQLFKNRYSDVLSKSWHGRYIQVLDGCARGDTKYARENIDVLIHSGQGLAIGWYVPLLSDLYRQEGAYDIAIDLIESTVADLTRANELLSHPALLCELAQCYFALDKTISKRVAHTLQRAAELASQMNIWPYQLLAMVILGEYEVKLGQSVTQSSEIKQLLSFENSSRTYFYRRAMSLVNRTSTTKE